MTVISGIVPDTIPKCMERYEKVDGTTHKVIEAFGGLKEFCALPFLPWQDRFEEGGTDYIDGVQLKDVSHPIMRGEDPFRRPFVTVKTRELNSKRIDNQPPVGVEALFQRYSENSRIWATGRHHSLCEICQPYPENLQALLEGKQVPAYCGRYSSVVLEK